MSLVVVWFDLTVADSMKEATRPPCVAVLRRGKDTRAHGKFPCPRGWLWCGTGALRENLHQTGISGRCRDIWLSRSDTLSVAPVLFFPLGPALHTASQVAQW